MARTEAGQYFSEPAKDFMGIEPEILESNAEVSCQKY